MSTNGVNHCKSMPYTPQQNGAAERQNRTLVKSAHSMIQPMNLPIKLRTEAININAYVINLMGRTAVEKKTIFELYIGHKTVTFNNFRVLGIECEVHVQNQKCETMVQGKFLWCL